MRHRRALGPTLRSALAAHHLVDGVLDLALKLFHALMQTTLTVFGAQLFHLLGPAFFPADPLNWLSYGGALVVVCGAGLIAVGPLLHPLTLFHNR